MFPWLWFLAPQIHLPGSGSVSQNIHPETNWFSDNIKGNAGDPDIERTVFSVASYGRQLGLITDVLIALAEQQNLTAQNQQADEALKKLKDLKTAIDSIKKLNKEP